jgi:hypothetical protein
MKIQLDLDSIPASWAIDDYSVIQDFWEDGDEWCHLEILSPQLRTWIRLKMPEAIFEDTCL